MKRIAAIVLGCHVAICFLYNLGLNGILGIPGALQFAGTLVAIFGFWTTVILWAIKKRSAYGYMTGICLIWWCLICTAQLLGGICYKWQFNRGTRQLLDGYIMEMRAHGYSSHGGLTISHQPFTAVFPRRTWYSRTALIYEEGSYSTTLSASRSAPNMQDLGFGWHRWVFGSYDPVFTAGWNEHDR